MAPRSVTAATTKPTTKTTAVPKSLLVTIDTREKTPLSFPSTLLFCDANICTPVYAETWHRIAIRTEKRTLVKAGDITLPEWVAPDGRPWTGSECKRSMSELHANCVGFDRDRFKTALAGFLGAYHRPILVLDFPVSEYQINREDIQTIDRLWATVGMFPHCSVIWGGRRASNEAGRKRLGALVLRTMLAWALASARSA